jgi:membrane associated rhomboid family serine protease
VKGAAPLQTRKGALLASRARMATCYRHPGRETGVSCSNCGRPICPDCMTPTPVGMRCPECSRERTPVRTLASIGGDPVLTYVLIGINVVLFFGSRGASSAYADLELDPTKVADGEVWRLVTGAFLHAQGSFGFLHIGFNMYLLWILGQMLEPSLGKWRFGAIYFASLLTGALGAVLANPDSSTVGASGAVFGLMGAGVVFLRARGIDPMQSGLGPTILINLLLPFFAPGLHISIGGHVGGLIGGFVAGYAVTRLSGRRASAVLPVLVCGALGLAAAVAAYLAAP